MLLGEGGVAKGVENLCGRSIQRQERTCLDTLRSGRVCVITTGYVIAKAVEGE